MKAIRWSALGLVLVLLACGGAEQAPAAPLHVVSARLLNGYLIVCVDRKLAQGEAYSFELTATTKDGKQVQADPAATRLRGNLDPHKPDGPQPCLIHGQDFAFFGTRDASTDEAQAVLGALALPNLRSIEVKLAPGEAFDAAKVVDRKLFEGKDLEPAPEP